jgi:hypothetical protein
MVHPQLHHLVDGFGGGHALVEGEDGLVRAVEDLA